MKAKRILVSALAIAAVMLLFPATAVPQIPPTTQLISESSLLAGLAPGALFPFIDTTPNHVKRAHIAITDATSNCAAGAAAPANIQVLAGVAGGTLSNVMTAATNTGIGTATQCVFHVTVVGSSSLPITDIVVVNANAGVALTGANTITVSAEVK